MATYIARVRLVEARQRPAAESRRVGLPPSRRQPRFLGWAGGRDCIRGNMAPINTYTSVRRHHVPPLVGNKYEAQIIGSEYSSLLHWVDDDSCCMRRTPKRVELLVRGVVAESDVAASGHAATLLALSGQWVRWGWHRVFVGGLWVCCVG